MNLWAERKHNCVKEKEQNGVHNEDISNSVNGAFGKHSYCCRCSAHGYILFKPHLHGKRSVRTYAGKYHVAEKSANTIWAGIASPYMGLDDLRWFTKQIGNLGEYFALNKQLFDSLLITKVRNFGLEYQVPIGFISGADDWTTPVKYSEDYCNLITAPEKKTAWIDGCGHAPQYDDPEAFCKELKGMLKEFVTEELEK